MAEKLVGTMEGEIDPCMSTNAPLKFTLTIYRQDGERLKTKS